MRKVGFGVIALAVGVAPAAVSADVFHTFLAGTVALANIADVSKNGCIETTGQLAAVRSTDGTYAIASVQRIDHCHGDAGKFYGGGGPVSYGGLGLIAASAHGTIVADEYTGHGIPPLTIEFSLLFAGTGETDTNVQHFYSDDGAGGVTASFSAAATRAANVTGSLKMDGKKIAIESGQLASQIQGELVIVP